MATKRPGAYTPLAVNYADDEAIMDAGEDAELMYVRILAFCGRTPKTEGWVSDKQIRTRLGLETRPEVGPETAPEKRAETLAEVGLLTRERDGYRVTAWLKWNRSAEEIARTQGQDRERKNGLTSTDTGKRPGNGTGKQTGNDPGSSYPDTETDTDTKTGVARKRATQLSESFQPSEGNLKLAAEHGVDLRVEWPQFRDYHVAKASKFVDWPAALNTWIRRAKPSNVRPMPLRADGYASDDRR